MSASTSTGGPKFEFDWHRPDITVRTHVPLSETEREQVVPCDMPIPMLAWVLSRWLVVEGGELKMRESFGHD